MYMQSEPNPKTPKTPKTPLVSRDPSILSILYIFEKHTRAFTDVLLLALLVRCAFANYGMRPLSCLNA